MNINKATGKDGISVKILKIAKPVVPLHKKNSQLEVVEEL
jgi:hypothetical protein